MKKTEKFIRESNAIEGYYDLELSSDYYLGHLQSYEYLVNEFEHGNELTEKMILESHNFLMQDLIEKKYSGNYRDCGVRVGFHIAPYFYQLPRLVEILLDKIKKIKTIQDVWDSHFLYESIHPFIDGNGRSGRSLLNALMVKHGFPIVIIESEFRGDYYNKIIEWRDKYFDKIIDTYGAR